MCEEIEGLIEKLEDEVQSSVGRDCIETRIQMKKYPAVSIY